jgi:hypothetical protein
MAAHAWQTIKRLHQQCAASAGRANDNKTYGHETSGGS